MSVRDRPLDPRHILLVRAPDLVRPLLIHDLEGAGYEVTPVDTPSAAIAVLEKRAPIVVLIDMDGATPHRRGVFTVASMLRPAPRVIALAPFGHERGFRDAIAMGAFCCLPLPVTRELLLEAMHTAEDAAGQESDTAVSSPSEG